MGPLVFPAKNELFTVDGFLLVMRSEAEEHFATLPWRWWDRATTTSYTIGDDAGR